MRYRTDNNAMTEDICYACDGTGERCWLSGAPCFYCNGTGWIHQPEWTDEDSDLWEEFHEEFYTDG
jgi:DnaJ-class molecular chaperone